MTQRPPRYLDSYRHRVYPEIGGNPLTRWSFVPRPPPPPPVLMASCVMMMLSPRVDRRGKSALGNKHAGQMRNESAGTRYNVHAWRLLIRRPADLFHGEQLRGESRQIRARAKQRYAFASTVALSFIFIKQRLQSRKIKKEMITARWPGCGYLQGLLSSRPASRPHPLNVNAQPEGPLALQSEALIGHLSFAGIDRRDNSRNANCAADRWRTPESRSRGTAIIPKVSTPIVALLFSPRQLLPFPYYRRINLMFGIRHGKYSNFKLKLRPPPPPLLRKAGTYDR